MNLLETALSQYGVKEIPGKKHNNVILNYFKEIHHTWVTKDETAWCAAFMNWCALNANLRGSGKLNARSFIEVGEEVIPQLGDIVVFWRESKSSWKGHVGIYISEGSTIINVLGGNQSNKVCIKPYPKARVLSYRRLHAI